MSFKLRQQQEVTENKNKNAKKDDDEEEVFKKCSKDWCGCCSSGIWTLKKQTKKALFGGKVVVFLNF